MKVQRTRVSPNGSPRRENAQNILRSARWILATAWETNRNLTVSIVAVSLLNGALPAIQAWVIRSVINLLVDAANGRLASFDPIALWLGIGLVVTLLQTATSSLTEYYQAVLKLQIELRINVDTLKHASTLDLAQFQDSEFQDTMSRATENIGSRVSISLSALTTLSVNLLQFISTIILMLAIDPIALLLALPVSAPYVWTQWRFARMRFQKKYNRATRHRWANYFSGRITAIDTMPELKIYNLAPLLLGRYREIVQDFTEEEHQIHAYELRRSLLFEMLFSLVLMGVFFYQAYRVFLGQFLLGDLVIYNRMALLLLSLVQRMSRAFSQIVENVLYVSNLTRFYEAEPSIRRDVGIVPTEFRGEVELRDVSFAYPGTEKLALRDINLRIEPGETVAIVGENGAGKSTLAMLLTRLYDPTTGCVLIDGYDARELNVNALQRQIAFVTQRSVQYEASAADNIAYGDWERLLDNRAAVEGIAQRAQIHEMISAMPKGYDTLLGRRFGEYDLSGGQWQRISIGRAVARNPKLLILDEPTASLDARAEHEIFSQFHQLAAGCTTVIISHRFSTVSMADRIIVLHKGRVIESGTHEALMALGGQYASLYRLHEVRFSSAGEGR